jgi:hypothetical protein
MRGLFTSQSFQLKAGEVLSGRAKQAQVLRIKSGSAWVTIEGIGHDYWLAAGDALRVAKGRLVVVEAQSSGFQAQMAGETVAAHTLPAQAWQVLRAWSGRKLTASRAGSDGAQCCA